MKLFGPLLFVALVAAFVSGYERPASAELRFCNLTSTKSLIVEGHFAAGKGLEVNGTFVVEAGRCGIVVPGRLAARQYFLHIGKAHDSFGGTDHLCMYDLYHFTIEHEDAPGFKCRGKVMPDGFHMTGFVNAPMHLAAFASLTTNGEATVTVTQRKDSTIHFVLK